MRARRRSQLIANSWLDSQRFIDYFERVDAGTVSLETPYGLHAIINDEDYIVASNKGRAFFALSGYHFNPDDITRLVGVEPTSTNAAVQAVAWISR